MKYPKPHEYFWPTEQLYHWRFGLGDNWSTPGGQLKSLQKLVNGKFPSSISEPLQISQRLTSPLGGTFV